MGEMFSPFTLEMQALPLKRVEVRAPPREHEVKLIRSTYKQTAQEQFRTTARKECLRRWPWLVGPAQQMLMQRCGVHHKHPVEIGGDNDQDSNLVLIDGPLHKRIHRRIDEIFTQANVVINRTRKPSLGDRALLKLMKEGKDLAMEAPELSQIDGLSFDRGGGEGLYRHPLAQRYSVYIQYAYSGIIATSSSAMPKHQPILDTRIEQAGWRKIPRLKAHLEKAAQATLKNLPANITPGTVTLLLSGDAAIRRLNRDFRGIDKPTNVLSFPQFAPGKYPRKGKAPPSVHFGDVAMGYQYIVAEAKKDHKILINHVSHLLIHGLLHLFGYHHSSDTAASRMERLETKIMKQLGLPDPYAFSAPRPGKK